MEWPMVIMDIRREWVDVMYTPFYRMAQKVIHRSLNITLSNTDPFLPREATRNAVLLPRQVVRPSVRL